MQGRCLPGQMKGCRFQRRVQGNCPGRAQGRCLPGLVQARCLQKRVQGCCLPPKQADAALMSELQQLVEREYQLHWRHLHLQATAAEHLQAFVCLLLFQLLLHPQLQLLLMQTRQQSRPQVWGRAGLGMLSRLLLPPIETQSHRAPDVQCLTLPSPPRGPQALVQVQGWEKRPQVHGQGQGRRERQEHSHHWRKRRCLRRWWRLPCRCLPLMWRPRPLSRQKHPHHPLLVLSLSLVLVLLVPSWLPHKSRRQPAWQLLR